MLRLLRTEGATAFTILNRTLHAFQLARDRRRRGLRQKTLSEQLAIAEAAAAKESELHALADDYLSQRAELQAMAEEFERCLRGQMRPWLQPGRMMRLHEQRAWAVLVSAPGLAGAAAEAGRSGMQAPPLQGSTELHVLARRPAARKRPRSEEDLGSNGRSDGDASNNHEFALAAQPSSSRAHASTEHEEPSLADGVDEMSVVSLPLSAVHQFAAARLWMPRDLHDADARASVALALKASLDTFNGCVPLLDPIEHMQMSDPDFLQLVDDIEAAEHALRAHPLHRSSRLQEAYERRRTSRLLRLELAQMADAAEGKCEPLLLLSVAGEHDEVGEAAMTRSNPHVKGMRRMLERLEYIGADDVLLVKGRAACCIDSGDELLIVEVLANGERRRTANAACKSSPACTPLRLNVVPARHGPLAHRAAKRFDCRGDCRSPHLHAARPAGI